MDQVKGARTFGATVPVTIDRPAFENAWVRNLGSRLVGLAGVLAVGFADPALLVAAIFNATPLVLLALAFSIPLRAGFYNIGAEGQLLAGGMLAATIGSSASVGSSEILIVGCVLAAALAGSGVAYLAWVWKRAFEVNEVVTTLLLTLLIQAFTSYLVAISGDGQSMRTPLVRSDIRLVDLVEVSGRSLSVATGWAIVALAAYSWFLKTRSAVVFKAIGLNSTAAAFAGYRVGLIQGNVVAIAGGLAGLASLQEILFHSGAFFEGFASGMGFTGIAVALLFGSSPTGIGLSALVFGILQEVFVRLQVYGVPSAVGYALQGSAILLVMAIRGRREGVASNG